jgi:type IV fimbrial biogenesis protein FimT
MVGLAVLALLVGIGVPAFKDMMKNYQIRTAAESLVSGLQTTRNEAVRRNTTVRFQLVNTLDADCNTLQSGPHWIISRNDPGTKCDQAPVTDFLEPNDIAQPQILMKGNNASNGTATINATAGGAAAVRVIYNSLGRLDSGSIDTIDVTNPSGGNCESDASPGNMRCMRIRIGAGGQVKMCDPKVSDTADSRYCQ